MSTEVLCCFEDQPVEEAARIMAEHAAADCRFWTGWGRGRGWKTPRGRLV
jgi:hypothetical protein